MKRALLAAALVAGATVVTPPPAEAAGVTCSLQFVYSGGVARGGRARCYNAYRWRVVVACDNTRNDPTPDLIVYGPNRYENGVGGYWSEKWCPSTKPYAYWVSREYIA